MDMIVARVLKVQADAYKLVTMARKPSDNMRVLAAAKALTRHRMVVLAMGEIGFPTRILSPIYGGFYTYAAQPFRGHGYGPGVRAPLAQALQRGETWQGIESIRRNRRSGTPFHFPGGA